MPVRVKFCLCFTFMISVVIFTIIIFNLCLLLFGLSFWTVLILFIHSIEDDCTPLNVDLILLQLGCRPLFSCPFLHRNICCVCVYEVSTVFVSMLAGRLLNYIRSHKVLHEWSDHVFVLICFVHLSSCSFHQFLIYSFH